MARAGVTAEDVMRAAEDLALKGESITIERVRAALGGTGSNTTVSKYLQAWREQRGKPVLPTANSSPQIVKAAVEHVWQQMREETAAEIAQITEDAESKIQAAEAKLSETELDYQNLQQKFNELQQQYQRKSAEKELLTIDFNESRQEQLLLQEKHQNFEQQYQAMQIETANRIADMQHSQEQIKQNFIERNEELNQVYAQSINELKALHEEDRAQLLLKMDALTTETKKHKKIADDLMNQLFEAKEATKLAKHALEQSQLANQDLKQQINAQAQYWSQQEKQHELSQETMKILQQMSESLGKNQQLQTSVNTHLMRYVHGIADFLAENMKVNKVKRTANE